MEGGCLGVQVVGNSGSEAGVNVVTWHCEWLAGFTSCCTMKGMRQALSQSLENKHQPMCPRPKGNWADLIKATLRWW